MRTNADITIYNKYVDSNANEAYLSHQIEGVAWENRKASNVLASGGDLKADSVVVYIPVARGSDYIGSREWIALSDKGDNWTLQIGDVLVRGLVSDVISGSFTKSDLIRKYNDVVTVKSVDLYDNGSISQQHWKLSAQ